MDEQPHTLLVCTVGGSPEPIVATLKHWVPQRIQFVVSPETRGQIDQRIGPLARSEGLGLEPGRYDILELPDSQNFEACVATLRRIETAVREWLGRGERFQVVVDFTGGTKCMTAALALIAHRWPCIFSYVGGMERNKGGLGVVVSGKEQVLHTHNPWDAMGFQAVEHFIVLFDGLNYSAAAEMARQTKKQMSDPTRKREFQSLEWLAEAYDAWDRFEHGAARSKLNELKKAKNDLLAVLGETRAERLFRLLAQHEAYLQDLLDGQELGFSRVLDLLANARRRATQGRFDDATARLYRCIEFLAQKALAQRHGIPSTAAVPIERIPEALRREWEMSSEPGTVRLGLQQAYQLLDATDDPLGKKFKQLGLDARDGSALVARNQSILAHGFSPVGRKVFEALWKAALELARTEDFRSTESLLEPKSAGQAMAASARTEESELTESRLPTFPQLGTSS